MSPKSIAVLLGAAALAFLLLGSRGGDISAEEAHRLVAGGALLLDVRTPGEFAERHLDGAVNIPVQSLPERLAAVPARKDQDVVVYCRSGRRSASARKILEEAGFTRVHDLGGIGNW